MQEVDQAFLLAFAGVAGTLLGTFVVGVFFYIDSEMHMRLEGRWGDLHVMLAQHGADRLDTPSQPTIPAVLVRLDEGD